MTVVRQTQRETRLKRERDERTEKSSVVCDVCRAMGHVCEIYTAYTVRDGDRCSNIIALLNIKIRAHVTRYRPDPGLGHGPQAPQAPQRRHEV